MTGIFRHSHCERRWFSTHRSWICQERHSVRNRSTHFSRRNSWKIREGQSAEPMPAPPSLVTESQESPCIHPPMVDAKWLRSLDLNDITPWFLWEVVGPPGLEPGTRGWWGPLTRYYRVGKSRNVDGSFAASTEPRTRPTPCRTRLCRGPGRGVGKSKKRERLWKPKSEPVPNRTAEIAIFGSRCTGCGSRSTLTGHPHLVQKVEQIRALSLGDREWNPGVLIRGCVSGNGAFIDCRVFEDIEMFQRWGGPWSEL